MASFFLRRIKQNVLFDLTHKNLIKTVYHGLWRKNERRERRKNEEKRRNRGERGDDFLSGVMLGKRELGREEGVGSKTGKGKTSIFSCLLLKSVVSLQRACCLEHTPRCV